MKENSVRVLRWLFPAIALVVLAVVINFILALRPSGSSQRGEIEDLQAHLVQLGVPVKSVTVITKSPLEIEVVLHSAGKEDHLGQGDLWNKFVAEREIELAHLNSTVHIESYRLILANDLGNSIYDSTVFLNPDLPSQKVTPAPASSVKNNQAKEILEKALNLQGLILATLDVPASFDAGGNSRLVTMELSTGAPAESTEASKINAFLIDLGPQVEQINAGYNTNIMLIRAQIKDADGRLLAEYMQDLLIGRQSAWTSEIVAGLGDGFPQPAPAVSCEEQGNCAPAANPTATSAPSPAQPTATANKAAYPPPGTPYP